MTNGLGASYGGLLLLVILVGLAIVLTLSLIAATIFRRHRGTLPSGYHYIAALLSAGVLLVSGFAVIALSDEAAALAVVFVGLVFVPLGTCVTYLHRRTALSHLEVFATTGVAWSLPFLLGLTTTFGGLRLVTSVFSITSSGSQYLGLHWITTVVGAVVVILGTLLFSAHLTGTLGTQSISVS